MAVETQVESPRKNETVQKLPKKNPNGYSHTFTPSEQGLPDYDTAMQQSGLIK